MLIEWTYFAIRLSDSLPPPCFSLVQDSAAATTPPAINSERLHPTPSASTTTSVEVSMPSQFNLDRPRHKATSGGLAHMTPAPAINLDRPLRKAKSAQSYAGLPPSDARPSFGPGNGTHPSLKQELTTDEWADEKLAFPRSKVGDGFYHIFSD